MTRGRGAVFLDRDGVLNERPPPHKYVTQAHEFRWLPGAADAVARLTDAGLLVFVVSNQRGIARRLVSWDTLAQIEARIQDELGRRGSAVTSFYYCPHNVTDGCDCRKPKPGLVLRAAKEHRLDLNASTVIGDDESDVAAGHAAGCATIRIGPAGTSSRADAVAGTLLDASALVLRRRSALPS